MKVEFDRFEEQCNTCPCFIENCTDDNQVDPDCDCTLGHETSGNKFCHDCGE